MVEARLDIIERSLKDHEASLQSLEVQHRALQNDHDALCECILAARILKMAVLDLPVLEACRRTRRTAIIFREFLQVPELSCAFGQAAGLLAMCRFSATSRFHQKLIQASLPELAMLPCELYVCGLALEAPDTTRYTYPGKTGTKVIESFNPIDGHWTQIPQPERVCSWTRYAATAAGGNLYIFGGRDGSQRAREAPHFPIEKVLARAECFDPATNCWKALRAMPTARDDCVAATSGGLIYVFGGVGTNEQILSIVEQFDPSTGRWAQVSSMPTARCGCAAAATSGDIYVVGGRGLATVETFTPKANVWQTLPPMTVARDRGAAAALGGVVYVFGGGGMNVREHSFLGEQGSFVQASAEYFNRFAGCWESLPPMQIARAGCAAVATAGLLYVFGGVDYSHRFGPRLPVSRIPMPLGTVECFDPKTSHWVMMPSMTTVRGPCAATAVQR